MTQARYEHLESLPAYNEGREKGERGIPHANPYPPTSDNHAAYSLGWREGDDYCEHAALTPEDEEY